MSSTVGYPVRVEASLDPPLSRWVWLVKWFLAIPHYLVLGVLWLAFAVLSVAAFVAILVTGRYPRPLFAFNVGVLRWTWRVQYYAYGALGTDRYPPFTLADRPDYPARLDVAYPEHLSRGLVLVKWWLLAIPHYLITGLFVGGGTWAALQFDNQNFNWGGGGLIGILVLVAAIVLAVTGRYPRTIYDFVLGMNRWVLRVAAYAGLMTDEYPPFRLDMGGHDPGGTLAINPSPTTGPAPDQPPAAPRGDGWTPGRVASAVSGGLLLVLSLGLLGVGGAALWADQTQRDAAGYVPLGSDTVATSGYAVVSDRIELYGAGADSALGSLVGTARLRVTSTDPTTPVFVGIAPAAEAARYLHGVGYTTVRNLGGDPPRYAEHAGGAPPVAPQTGASWVAHATGPGTQTLYWRPTDGAWTVVAMNPGRSPGVTVHSAVAATLPALPWIATGFLVGGALVLAAGVLLVAVPARRAAR